MDIIEEFGPQNNSMDFEFRKIEELILDGSNILRKNRILKIWHNSNQNTGTFDFFRNVYFFNTIYLKILCFFLIFKYNQKVKLMT